MLSAVTALEQHILFMSIDIIFFSRFIFLISHILSDYIKNLLILQSKTNYSLK